MFIGYAQDHTIGIYHMVNIRTKRIVLSRDIICFKKPMENIYQGNKILGQIILS